MRSTLTSFVVCVSALTAAYPARASSIQKQPPDKLFAAICATCHGPVGTGGVSWIDGSIAPWIAGASSGVIKSYVRRGYGRSMPAFSSTQITDEEIDSLTNYLHSQMAGVRPPTAPTGKSVLVDILDADPWYADDMTDRDPDRRRIELFENEYLKVINTGRTWHTLTNDDLQLDSGFIGFSQYQETGYYYAEQGKDLAPGCVAYHCHLHPYMQVEVCSAGNRPAPLSRLNKNPIAPPAAPGSGEIWVDMQTQEEDSQDPDDGAIQVVDASTWQVQSYIPDAGNNPHSSWAGKLSDGRNVVATSNWHDNFLTLVDADWKQVIAKVPTGAAPAHLQVSPMDQKTWVLSQHGTDGMVMKLDMDRLAAGEYPVTDALRAPGAEVQSGSHGIWFCDDGDHFITANTFSNSVSLFSLSRGEQVDWAETDAEFTLNPSVMMGQAGGCRKAYVTNFDSASISLFDIDVKAGLIRRSRLIGDLADEHGNLKLADTAAAPVRWAGEPTQSVVSPPDGTNHGQYLVISNKTSFNASIVKLDAAGMPSALYNFPSGFGAHGVAFGRKARCDSDNPADVCYYAYIANTFDDYVSVYDLEAIERGRIGPPGSSLETIHVEGDLARLLANNPQVDSHAGTAIDVPITVFCPDCRSGGHVGDVPVRLTTQRKYAYLKQRAWIDNTPFGGSIRGVRTLDLEANTNTGGFGIMVHPGMPPWH